MNRNVVASQPGFIEPSVFNLVRSPTAEDLWRFLTYKNPIFACFVKYLSLIDMIKFIRVHPAIGALLRVEFPLLDQLMDNGLLLDFNLFAADTLSLDDVDIILNIIKPERVRIPHLGSMDTPFLLRIFCNSSVRELDLTLNGDSQFLVYDTPIINLIVRREVNGYDLGVGNLLRSCYGLESLELHRCDIREEDIMHIKYMPLREIKMIDLVPSLFPNSNFVFAQFSEMRFLNSFSFTQLGVFYYDWSPRIYHNLIKRLRPWRNPLQSLEISVCEHVEFPILLELPFLQTLIIHLDIHISQRAINKLCLYLCRLNGVVVTVKVFDPPKFLFRSNAIPDRSWGVYWARNRDRLMAVYPTIIFVPFHNNFNEINFANDFALMGFE